MNPHVRALVSSGYADDPVMANPAAYGFKGTVAKPYSMTALREAVAQLLTCAPGLPTAAGEGGSAQT